MATGAVIAASAVTSALMEGMAGASANLNQAQLVRSQNAARIKKMNQQFAFDTQNMYNNEVTISQQRFKNDVLIEENKLAAQDAFAQAFAGSGVSGRSVDRLEAQISGDVAKAHGDNQTQATLQKNRQFLGLMRKSQANLGELDNMIGFDAGAAKAASDMATLSAGIQSGVSAYTSSGDLGFNKGFGS